MTDTPPVQRDEAWLARATPEQIAAADEAGQLAALLGNKLDVEGWPLDSHGHRVTFGTRR